MLCGFLVAVTFYHLDNKAESQKNMALHFAKTDLRKTHSSGVTSLALFPSECVRGLNSFRILVVNLITTALCCASFWNLLKIIPLPSKKGVNFIWYIARLRKNSWINKTTFHFLQLNGWFILHFICLRKHLVKFFRPVLVWHQPIC